MLAEQMHDLQSAEDHYEQHLAISNAQQASETAGQGRAAAFANVMKVRCLSLMTLLTVCCHNAAYAAVLILQTMQVVQHLLMHLLSYNTHVSQQAGCSQ